MIIKYVPLSPDMITEKNKVTPDTIAYNTINS